MRPATEQGDVTFMIDQRGAVIRRVLEKSGLPATIFLPARAFRGVAARALEGRRRQRHRDARAAAQRSRSYRALLVARISTISLPTGGTWAEEYRLPMLLIEADGIARTLEESLGSVKSAPVKDRRKRSSLQPRRPRFLARRKSATSACAWSSQEMRSSPASKTVNSE